MAYEAFVTLIPILVITFSVLGVVVGWIACEIRNSYKSQ